MENTVFHQYYNKYIESYHIKPQAKTVFIAIYDKLFGAKTLSILQRTVTFHYLLKSYYDVYQFHSNPYLFPIL